MGNRSSDNQQHATWYEVETALVFETQNAARPARRLLQVQEGNELLSPPDDEELALLAKGNLPPRWRLSCKTIVGKDNTSGAARIKAVPQTEWRAQRGIK